MATVLVVDDDDALRFVCRTGLELDGYRVLEAGTHEEAIAALEAESVAVVLLDVKLGLDDGLRLLEPLRARWPRVGVAFLRKPFELAVLHATVRELAGRSLNVG